MFKTTRQLKNFILWAKENKVKSFKIADLEVELSEIAFIPEQELPELSINNTETMVDTEKLSEKEYEDLLFHSVG